MSPPAPAPTIAATAKPESGWSSAGQRLVFGGIVDSGTMPKEAAIGIEAAAAQSWTTSTWGLRLMAGASFFLPQDLPNQMIAYVPYGRYWMVSFSGRGCLTAVIARFEVGPCFGGELVVMHATNISGPSFASTQYWASPLGSAVAALTVVPRLVLFARVDIAFPTTRRSFMSEPDGGGSDVYKVPSSAVRGALGLELRFF